MRRFIVFSGLLAVVSAGMASVPTPSAAQGVFGSDYGYRDYPPGDARSVVRCESEDFSFKQCPVRTDGRVHLIRELSDTPCLQGQNWGYDRRGIWVDDGCAAEFRVAGRYADNRDWWEDRHRREARWDRTVRCESEGFEFKRCAAPGSDRVRIARQLSETPCRRGQNWGYDHRGIWVDDGCAAEFHVASPNAYGYYGR